MQVETARMIRRQIFQVIRNNQLVRKEIPKWSLECLMCKRAVKMTAACEEQGTICRNSQCGIYFCERCSQAMQTDGESCKCGGYLVQAGFVARKNSRCQRILVPVPERDMAFFFDCLAEEGKAWKDINSPLEQV